MSDSIAVVDFEINFDQVPFDLYKGDPGWSISGRYWSSTTFMGESYLHIEGYLESPAPFESDEFHVVQWVLGSNTEHSTEKFQCAWENEGAVDINVTAHYAIDV